MDGASAEIGIELERNKVELLPGQCTTIRIKVTNYSKEVDQYTIVLDRLPPSWYTLDDFESALFPGDSEDVKLVLRVPDVTRGTANGGSASPGQGIRPGDYDFSCL